MTLDITKIIEAIGGTFKSASDCFKTSKEHQCETQLVKDKKRLKEATNVAQRIFQITDKYKSKFHLEDAEDYTKLRKLFDKKD